MSKQIIFGFTSLYELNNLVSNFRTVCAVLILFFGGMFRRLELKAKILYG